MTSSPAALIHVHFLLLPDSLILDWAGPAEALRIANQRRRHAGLPDAFTLRFIGPQAKTTSSVGATITDLLPLPDTLPDHSWVVLVGQPGHCIAVESKETQATFHWLRHLHLQVDRLELITVCAGAVLAGHAGMLRGHRVTTHHEHLGELRQVAPSCDVVDNRVFVIDGPIASSAGVTTGIDLFLHRIAAVCGPALAAQTAQAMVVAMRRGPNDPELSPFLSHRNHLHLALHRVQDAIAQHPQGHWSLASMAKVACTSPRNLTRLFVTHADITPLKYLRSIRLDVAEAALRTGLNVTQAAHIAGFSSDTQLRRTWRQMFKPGTPSSSI